MIFRLFVWFLFLVGGTILGIYLDMSLFPYMLKNIIWHLVSFVFGFALLKIVMTISRNTGRTLAKYGREGKLPRMETNRLVKSGIYSCMRHPMHLGLMLFPVAVAFLSGSISFILFIAPAEIIFMIIMIFSLEEPEAIRKFGQEYINYKKEVPAFNFSKTCLKMLFKKVEK